MPYTFLEHTSDIRMRVTGTSLKELFTDALAGMMAAVRPIQPLQPVKAQRTIALQAGDATALLVEFLSEALAWTHREQEVYTSVRFMAVNEHALNAQLSGYQASSFAEDIKAVTYHEADVVRDAQGTWSTNIIFDI